MMAELMVEMKEKCLVDSTVQKMVEWLAEKKVVKMVDKMVVY